MKQYSRVYARVDLDAIEYNMEQMKKHIGDDAQIIAVVKMDGYGHGAAPIARMFEEKDYIWGYATASLEEAISLRNSGIEKPILVLGCVFPEQYEDMLTYDIRTTIYMEETAREISKAAQKLGKTACFHIKIDTGMGRLGFLPNQESIQKIAEISRLPHVNVEGVFTHFAKADETDKSYTLTQHEKFTWVKNALEEAGIYITYYHCDNSAGIIDFPDMKHNLVRAGIATYGMYPSDEVHKEAVSLRPALELISHVTFVKEVEAGESISYGGTFTAKERMKVATVPVGYGDGYSRGLSNKADVLIHGKRARILGRVCMDQFMVDVTDIPDVKFMDQVVLVGYDQNEHITVEELSAVCGRFNYEFVCCLGRRIPRVYTKGGEVVEQVEYLS
ncbi:alanine racemase [Faecalicatena sp. AGMB00832]|uniref:Alanine racemase n=1 Tax=Faecalicatena faecalis TaxID=2726362 RepID=A0ABS6D422_9FIRM|nr:MULTISPECIES: alanine racemase [Faecalicatena]MBU3876343.1 alanine racemase [Faecalicatena faecalis]MCI6466470.1 alanine racemase [Faecalicatena sp.]MDY5618434.1 alanine racemase [Lachnospiraceae bacterium]